MKWIRRTKNTVADSLSRFVDLDDWGVHPSLKESLENLWWHCTVDRFATAKNAKLPQFNSRFACAETEAIDCLAQNWRDEVNWLVPPPQLIPQARMHLQKCRSKAILVAPFWPSARFWPFLFDWKGTTRMVVDWREIKVGACFLVPGSQPNSVFTPEKFRSSLLAVALDASSFD